MKRMNNLKNVIAARIMGGLVIGMTAVAGVAPVTVFAQSQEAECICEEKCSQDSINEECAVCLYDYNVCQGVDAHAEGSEECTETAEESYGPLTPDGNMNLVDDYGSIKAGGKQFITVTTKSGNYFYIIIDRDDKGTETVHFLNLVDESDLLKLMEDDEVESYMNSQGMTASEKETEEVKGTETTEEIKTLLHEMAHQKLHDKDNVPEAKDISRNGKEVEAESVAYVVCQHYGINTSDYSFSYVAGCSEGKETPELKASLDKIRQTASEFIYQIDQKMEVLMADKKQVQESAKAPSPFVQELMDKITEGAKDLGFIPVAPETQEKTANPELKVVVDKALKDLDKKRTLSKVKESVKSKLKANTEKAEQAPKKSRTSKAKEERA